MDKSAIKKFYLSVPQIDSSIIEIRKKIRVHMNGTTVELMKKSGINYDKNYGVSILDLRKIAAQYEQNSDLANRLWHLNIRETRILATMLMPSKTFSFSDLIQWLDAINQIELIEQLSMNLLSKKENTTEITLNLLKQKDRWKSITAFVLVARVWMNFEMNEVKTFMRAALKQVDSNDYLMYKTLAIAAGRLSRKSKTTAENIIKIVNESKSKNQLVNHYILNEVGQELIFLNC
jgi:3-methyladenine DNA glycosylase AlkD